MKRIVALSALLTLALTSSAGAAEPEITVVADQGSAGHTLTLTAVCATSGDIGCKAVPGSSAASSPVAELRPGALRIAVQVPDGVKSAGWGLAYLGKLKLPLYAVGDGSLVTVLPDPVTTGTLKITAASEFEYFERGADAWGRQFALRVRAGSAKQFVPVLVRGKEPRFKASVDLDYPRRPTLAGSVTSVGLRGRYVAYVTHGGRRVSRVVTAKLGTSRRFSLPIEADDAARVIRSGRLVVRRDSLSGPVLVTRMLTGPAPSVIG